MESTEPALMVSGAAAVAESTALIEGAAGSGFIASPQANRNAHRHEQDDDKNLHCNLYFFRKYNLNGTPLKLKDSRSLFSR